MQPLLYPTPASQQLVAPLTPTPTQESNKDANMQTPKTVRSRTPTHSVHHIGSDSDENNPHPRRAKSTDNSQVQTPSSKFPKQAHLGALAGVASKIQKQRAAIIPFRQSKSLPPDRNALLLTPPPPATHQEPPTPPLTQQSTTTQAYQDEEQPQEKIHPFDVDPLTDVSELTGLEDNDQKPPKEPDNSNDSLQPDLNLFG